MKKLAKIPPLVATIGGLDSSGGAGVGAHLRAFWQFSCHGMAVATAVVAETSKQVFQLEKISAASVRAQLRVLHEMPPQAILLSMLMSEKVLAELTEFLQIFLKNHPQCKFVIDPVAVASSGAALAEAANYPELLATQIFPLLPPERTIITPNIPEAQVLLASKKALPQQYLPAKLAEQIFEKYHFSVVLKGGHGQEDEKFCEDFLLLREENTVAPKLCSRRFLRQNPACNHGTGCALAAALAANLAQGKNFPQAYQQAADYLQQNLRDSFALANDKKLGSLFCRRI